jgi:YVTN family beta-propeller protein
MQLSLIYISIVNISIIITIHLFLFNQNFSPNVMIQNYLITIKIKTFEDITDNILNLVKGNQIDFAYASNTPNSASFIDANNKETSKDSSIMNSSDGNVVNTTIYENPANNLLIFYPSEWKVRGDENNISFLPPIKDKNKSFDTKLIINVSESGHVPLKEYASIQIIDLKQNKTHFNILDSGISLIAGNQAYKLTYSYSNNGKSYKIYQIWIMLDEKLYAIAFEATIENFDLYFSTIQKILNFIEIQGIAEATAHEQIKEKIPGLKVAIDPYEIVYNPISKKFFVTNFKFHTVSVIDESTDRSIKEIKVGKFPIALKVNLDLNTIYVSNSRSNSISVIDGATDSISDEISVGNNPVSLEIDNIEKGIKGLVFVVNSDSNSITVIDSTSNKILSNNITVGKNPSSIALDPITNRLYVTNKGSDSVSIIDYFLSDDNKFHTTSNSTIKVGNSPTGIAINPDKNTIYVANYYDNSISIINGSGKNVDDTINVETNPSSIDIDPSSNKIYVANYGSDSISVIDGNTNTIINTIKVDKFPRGLYYNQESKILHVISSQSNTISQIKNTTLLTGITYNINPPDFRIPNL